MVPKRFALLKPNFNKFHAMYKAFEPAIIGSVAWDQLGESHLYYWFNVP